MYHNLWGGGMFCRHWSRLYQHFFRQQMLMIPDLHKMCLLVLGLVGPISLLGMLLQTLKREVKYCLSRHQLQNVFPLSHKQIIFKWHCIIVRKKHFLIYLKLQLAGIASENLVLGKARMSPATGNIHTVLLDHLLLLMETFALRLVRVWGSNNNTLTRIEKISFKLFKYFALYACPQVTGTFTNGCLHSETFFITSF